MILWLVSIPAIVVAYKVPAIDIIKYAPFLAGGLTGFYFLLKQEYMDEVDHYGGKKES
jgi:hypothetical protein